MKPGDLHGQWHLRRDLGAIILIGSLAATIMADGNNGNELPAALAFIHANELKINRPGASDSIIIEDRSWAQPMTPVFVDAQGETILFTAHSVVRAGAREGVNIEVTNIYMAGPGGVKQLTDYGGFTVAPDFSRVRQSIIFAFKPRGYRRWLMPESNAMQLYMQDNNWNMSRCLTRTAGNKYNPQWSTDGKRVAFAWMEGDSLGIHFIEVATGRTVKVASRGDYPTWSLDDTSIAFSRNGRLFEIGVSDSGPVGEPRELLPNFRGYCSFLRWTESGLLFQWARSREQGISLYTPHDARVRVLVSGAGEYAASDLAGIID